MIERDYKRNIKTLFGLISADIDVKNSYSFTNKPMLKRETLHDSARMSIVTTNFSNKKYLGFSIHIWMKDAIRYIYDTNPHMDPYIFLWLIP